MRKLTSLLLVSALAMSIFSGCDLKNKPEDYIMTVNREEETTAAEMSKPKTKEEILFANRVKILDINTDKDKVQNILSQLDFPENVTYRDFGIDKNGAPITIVINCDTDRESRIFYSREVNRGEFTKIAYTVFSLIGNAEKIEYHLIDGNDVELIDGTYFRGAAEGALSEDFFRRTETFSGLETVLGEINSRVDAEIQELRDREPPAEPEPQDGVLADTKKELARYREIYPDKEEIVDIESPIITESESDKEGFKKYVINFCDLYAATLTIELPENLSVRLYNEGERLYADLRSMQPFYYSTVCICDKNNNDIGGISACTIAIDSRTFEINFGTIYQGLLYTGAWGQIDCMEIRQTGTESTAITDVCYPDFVLKDLYPHDYERLGNTDQGDRYFFNKGILSYNIDKLKYAAVEIDYDCISDEELQTVAESVRIS